MNEQNINLADLWQVQLKKESQVYRNNSEIDAAGIELPDRWN